MVQKRLLLISNSQQPGYRYLEHAEKQLCGFLGQTQEVLFIPYAAVIVSHTEYAMKVRKSFESWGYGLKSLHEVDNPAREIQRASAIVVGGGNTFQLLKTLYAKDLLAGIRGRVEAGTPYIGFSAGANIAGPTIQTTNDMPVVWPPSPESLGLVPFQINPHYTDDLHPDFGGETRETRITEFTVLNPDMYVIGLREGTMLHIEHGDISLSGGKPLKLFMNGRPPVDYGPEQSLDFLLRPHNR
jgi:dipeptidase E